MEWKQELMGKWVTFSHRLIKSKRYREIEWCKMPYKGTGMVIGRRWVKNGNLHHEGAYDEWSGGSAHWTEFRETESIPCLAIVRNDRENHIYIPYDCFELLEAEAAAAKPLYDASYGRPKDGTL